MAVPIAVGASCDASVPPVIIMLLVTLFPPVALIVEIISEFKASISSALNSK